MKEYYELLGISEDATDKQIKDAYIAMKNKYDPGSYEKEDLKKHAIEKTEQITKAFDEIMNSRRVDRMKNGESVKDSFDVVDTDNFEDCVADFDYIEELIGSDDLDEAEKILDSITRENRLPRWYYLKGLIFFKKGWLGEATEFFEAACRMEPQNLTYRQAWERAMWQRTGHFGNPGSESPYGNGSRPIVSCGVCDICAGLLCADCCCNCLGGSFMRGC